MSAVGSGARRFGGRGLPGLQRPAVLRERRRQHGRGRAGRGQHVSAAGAAARRPAAAGGAGRLTGQEGQEPPRRPRPTEDGAGEAEGQSRAIQLALLKAYAARPHAHAVVALFGHGLRAHVRGAGEAGVRRDVRGVGRRDPDDLEARARRALRRRDAAELLRQMAGADVARLRGDVERVLLYAAGRKRSGPTRSARSSTSAAAAGGGKKLWTDVANRRTAAALRELGLELAEGAVPFMILGLLRSVVERTVASRDLPRATRRAAQDGPRPEDLGRRSARAARTADRGVVRDREGRTEAAATRRASSPCSGQAGAATCTGRRRCRG